MAETQPHTQGTMEYGRLGGSRAHRAFGFFDLAIVVATLIFTLVTWWVGRLTVYNALVFALVVAGMAPNALMALRGDYPGARMDEGQREMWQRSLSDSFYAGYIGLYALFFASFWFNMSRGSM